MTAIELNHKLERKKKKKMWVETHNGATAAPGSDEEEKIFYTYAIS